MFTERQLQMLKLSNQLEINRLQEKLDRTELGNTYYYSKLDFPANEKFYLKDLVDLGKELDGLLLKKEEEGSG